MSSRPQQKIEQYLSDEWDSNESTIYDSDVDPEYIPARKRLLSCSSNTDTVTGHEPSTSNTDHLNSNSNYDISVGVSSSEDDCDLYDSNLWVDTKEDIPDFKFETTLSGIKINVPESARDWPIDLLKFCGLTTFLI